ncbi:TonB-dependent Receptor Plug Domain protein [compost metagenome]|uniref:TonB-linked SusC/RagA family outer membrane protein n=1 Tax=Flavobacterium endophyticum TaxID=1540163 RepID=A0A495M756_9FLAO|nr:SusC/RagA family TonB-linked outer membrane protein [Flavobacterium endophyticum]RKS21906.1 TonB-linked SusC/RagA family outer membrane protein [Flavobacterium endophyticum]
MKTKLNGLLTLVLALIMQISFAQERTISGTVADESGLPLPGVSIAIKGTTNGTQTDFDGKFQIKASPTDILVFSFMGMATQEVPATATNFNIILKDDATQLETVVVTALGIRRNPKELSYSTQVVKSDELNQAKAVNAATALVGKVSGLQINTINSGVNPQTRVVLRGARSISGNNEALIVIDGVPSALNTLSELNPNDIESTTILKGANAAALYGSAGSNGAIMITTKKGKNGKMTLQVNSTITFEKVQFIPDRQTKFGQGWAGELDPVENTNWGAPLDGSLVQVGPELADGTIREFTYTARKNNIKDFFNVGTTKQNGFSISQGDENSNLFFSAQDVKTEGIIPGDVYHKNTFRLNTSKTSGNWNVAGNVSYFTDKTDVAGNLTGSDDESSFFSEPDGGRSVYSQLLQTPINIPLEVYSQGDLQDYFTNYAYNPYWILKNSRQVSYSDRFQGSIDLGYKVNDWFNVLYRGGLSLLTSTFKNTNNGHIFTDGSGREDLNQGVSDGSNYERRINSDLMFNFDFKLNDDISAKITLGQNIRDIKTKELGIRGDNLVVEGLYNVSMRTGELRGAEFNSRLRSIGLYGSAEIGFRDYLFLNVTGRNDWSSALIKENNSFFYPSYGVSFIPTSAFPELKGNVLTFAKVTASYTKVGNSTSAYANQNTYIRSVGFPYGDLTSFNLSNTVALANLKPEFTTSKEFDLNLEFFKKRISLDASYYISNSTDQIINAAASSSSGATRALLNAGELQTKGFELDLGFTPIQTEDWNWDLRVSYSAPKTEVKSLLPGVNELSLGGFTTAGVYAVVGEEYPIIKGTAYERDDQGRVIIDQATGNPIQSSALKNLGKTTPDYIVGLSTNLNYKGFRLSAVFDYRTGHVFYNEIGQMLDFTGSSVQSAQSGRLPFVFPNSSYQSAPGVYTPNTSITTSSGGQPFWDSVYSNISENYVVDATAFKCREIAFSYTFSKKMLDNSPFEGITIGANARNVFMILPKANRYTDPEFGFTTGNAVGVGSVDEVPPTRTYGFNVTLTF